MICFLFRVNQTSRRADFRAAGKSFRSYLSYFLHPQQPRASRIFEVQRKALLCHFTVGDAENLAAVFVRQLADGVFLYIRQRHRKRRFLALFMTEGKQDAFTLFLIKETYAAKQLVSPSVCRRVRTWKSQSRQGERRFRSLRPVR